MKYLSMFLFLLLCASAPDVARAETVKLNASDGLRLNWGSFEAKTGLRLHADGIYSDDPAITRSDTDTDFRRARLTQRIDWGNWRLRADYDWGVSEGFKNLYLEYRGFERKRIRVGNHVAPFAMEDNESSSDLILMERSIASALRPGLLQGVSYRQWGKRWTAGVGVFGDEFNDLDRRTAPGQSAMGRVTFAPMNDAPVHLHFGLSYEHRDIDRGERVRYRARPFTRLAEQRVVDTRFISDADLIQNTNQEFGLAMGNVRLQSEMTQSRVDTNSQARRFEGFYAAVMTTIGAEPYRYSRSRGVYRGVEPKHKWGAIELGVRYSELDLNDGAINGGEAQETSVGASWVLNNGLEVRLNRARIETRNNPGGVDQSYDLTGLRLQWRI